MIEYWYDSKFHVSDNTKIPLDVFLDRIWEAVEVAFKNCSYGVIIENKKDISSKLQSLCNSCRNCMLDDGIDTKDIIRFCTKIEHYVSLLIREELEPYRDVDKDGHPTGYDKAIYVESEKFYDNILLFFDIVRRSYEQNYVLYTPNSSVKS